MTARSSSFSARLQEDLTPANLADLLQALSKPSALVEAERGATQRTLALLTPFLPG